MIIENAFFISSGVPADYFRSARFAPPRVLLLGVGRDLAVDRRGDEPWSDVRVLLFTVAGLVGRDAAGGDHVIGYAVVVGPDFFDSGSATNPHFV